MTGVQTCALPIFIDDGQGKPLVIDGKLVRHLPGLGVVDQILKMLGEGVIRRESDRGGQRMLFGKDPEPGRSGLGKVCIHNCSEARPIGMGVGHLLPCPYFSMIWLRKPVSSRI